VRAFLGHHVDQDGAVLGAVNASALRADRERECARLRALTAPPRSAVSWQLRDGRGVVEFDAGFVPGVSCEYLVGVDHDTPSTLPNAERAAAASQDPDRSAHLTHQHAAPMFDSGPTSDQSQSCSDNARRIDPR